MSASRLQVHACSAHLHSLRSALTTTRIARESWLSRTATFLGCESSPTPCFAVHLDIQSELLLLILLLQFLFPFFWLFHLTFPSCSS